MHLSPKHFCHAASWVGLGMSWKRQSSVKPQVSIGWWTGKKSRSYSQMDSVSYHLCVLWQVVYPILALFIRWASTSDDIDSHIYWDSTRLYSQTFTRSNSFRFITALWETCCYSLHFIRGGNWGIQKLYNVSKATQFGSSALKVVVDIKWYDS